MCPYFSLCVLIEPYISLFDEFFKIIMQPIHCIQTRPPVTALQVCPEAIDSEGGPHIHNLYFKARRTLATALQPASADSADHCTQCGL
jgi:hypothetical protein